MVSKSLYFQRDTAGLCVRCGGPRKDSLTKQCPDCIKGAKIKRETKKNNLTSQGLCILCGEVEATVNAKYCPNCHEKKKEIDRKIYKERLEKHLCVKCQKESATAYCSECSGGKKPVPPTEIGQYTKHCYAALGNCCSFCQKETDINKLSFFPLGEKNQIMLDIIKSYQNKEKQTYKLICNSCYRQMCIDNSKPTLDQLKPMSNKPLPRIMGKDV